MLPRCGACGHRRSRAYRRPVAQPTQSGGAGHTIFSQHGAAQHSNRNRDSRWRGILCPELVAAIRARRFVARGSVFAQLPGIVQDRTPLVLELASESTPELLRQLLDPELDWPTAPAAAAMPAPVERIVAMLTASGLAAARLDIPACRFAQSLAELGAYEDVIMQAVFELVIAPRTDLSERPPEAPQQDEPSEEPSEQPNNTEDPQEQPAQEPDSTPDLPPTPKPGRARNNRWPGRGGAEEASLTRGRTRRVLAWQEGAPLALIPTLAAAVPWQPLRRQEHSGRIVLKRDDLRTTDRVSRGGGLTIIVVDASGSMGIGAIRTAKAIALGVLDQGYRNRDRVAIVVARGREAYVGLPPTKSVSRARDCIRGLPTGGGTPLASGLLLAAKLAMRFPPERVRTIVLSDGAANVGLSATGKEPARKDARQALAQLEACSTVQLMPLKAGRRSRDSLAWLTTKQ